MAAIVSKRAGVAVAQVGTVRASCAARSTPVVRMFILAAGQAVLIVVNREKVVRRIMTMKRLVVEMVEL